MPHKIFLSHNHADKPVVEAVALRLASIFGRDEVFYDSWSIRPGEGIIDRMNEGLSAPEFVFFFVSEKSLDSGMVKLEWQNALYAASKGRTQIVPVRVDGAEMPAVLKQTLFIDMHTIGLEAAVAQIVSVTQGNASFTPQHRGFSNLSYSATSHADGKVAVTITASHLMEPNPHFILVLDNEEGEVTSELDGGMPSVGGFNKAGAKDAAGKPINYFNIRPMSGTLTPSHPMRVSLDPTGADPVRFIELLHQRGETDWTPVPRKPQ